MAGLLGRLWLTAWHKALSSPLLTLNGYVAFDLPRTVTALGTSLLMGLVAVHAYLAATRPGLPLYFWVYLAALIAACLAVAAAMAFAAKPLVPQAGWYAGSLVCAAFW